MTFRKYYRAHKRRIGRFAEIAAVALALLAIVYSVTGVRYVGVVRVFTTSPAGITHSYVPKISESERLSTLITLASSQPVLQSVIRKLDLPIAWEKLPVEVGQEGDASILRIEVTADHPREAKVIAQTIGEEFLAYIDALNKQEVRMGPPLEDHLEYARKELLDAKAKLQKFQERGALVRRIIERLQEKQALKQSLQNTKAELAELRARLDKTPKEVMREITVSVNPLAESLRRKRDELRVELVQEMVTKTPEHPEVKRIQRSLDQIERKLKEVESKEGMVVTENIQIPNPVYQMFTKQVARLQAEQQSLAAQISAMDKLLKRYKEFLPPGSMIVDKLNSLLHELSAREQTYLSLSHELDAIRAQEKAQSKLDNLILMGPPTVYRRYRNPLELVTRLFKP